ncbi:MAG: hypothetical protein IPM39_11460 [Chloroflexi bacterium]|nr:hypothetical protein [Chloroflexota bacterium]
MTTARSLEELQASVQDKSAFKQLADYHALTTAFLDLLAQTKPTRIMAPNDHRYVFFQYGKEHNYKITRPLNFDLFIETADEFYTAFTRLMLFLADMRQQGQTAADLPSVQSYLQTNEINKAVYTMQQSIGSIGDSFTNPNQSRKRIGQLFENLVKLLIQEMGFPCQPRTISVPIPDSPGYKMSYELDLVISQKGAIVTSESALLHPDESIGSVKTTSKDRIDKIFLDKFLLGRLLGREIKVVAIFLHDVQRAHMATSIFGVNSTFKTNHFLGYTLALNRLNGVYYVDPRPEMVSNPRLRNEIGDLQRFLTQDIWNL